MFKEFGNTHAIFMGILSRIVQVLRRSRLSITLKFQSARVRHRIAWCSIKLLNNVIDCWFDGVVGYHVCLTLLSAHRRSPVRARVEPVLLSPLPICFSVTGQRSLPCYCYTRLRSAQCARSLLLPTPSSVPLSPAFVASGLSLLASRLLRRHDRQA